MGLGDEDKEFLRQLAWVYPSDFAAEIRQLAEALITEQLAVGERQNIREIVSTIMAKFQLEAAGGPSPEEAAEAAAEQQAAAQAVREKVLAALAAKQPSIPAGMGPEAVLPLVEVLRGTAPELAGYARQALCSLTDGGAIDEICRLWGDSRQEDLAQIVVEAGYLASQPLRLRLLTVLKTGADRLMLQEDAALILELVLAADDADRMIAGRARRLLLTLTDPQAITALCEIVLSQNQERLRTWAVLANYAPAADSKAALYYCITGQWDKYYALDWQDARPLLAQGYNQATIAQRQQFLLAARQSGHSLLLLGLLLKDGGRAEYEEITDQDWAVMLDMLAGQERWAELYQLVLRVPANWAAEFVLTLENAAWQPQAWQQPDWERLVASCPQVGKTLVVPDGRQIAVLENREAAVSIDCAAFHPNGRLIAGGGSDGRLRLWQSADGKLWRTVNLHTDGITALAFSPDARCLVTAGRDAKTHIWQLPDIKWLSSVKGQLGPVAALAGDEHDRLLALACAGGNLPVRAWLWDGGVMTTPAQYPGSLFCAAAVNLKTRTIAGGGRDGRLRIYVLAGGTGSNKLWLAHAGQIEGLAYSADGHLLVSSGVDKTLKIWEADTGKLLWSTVEPGRLLAVSPSGARAVVSSPQGTISIRQLRFTKPLALATHTDWQYAATMKTAPELEAAAQQASCFVYDLLTAKFRYDIML